MKKSTREIIKLAISGDDSLTEAHRKNILDVLRNPEAAVVQENDAQFKKSIAKGARMFDMHPRTVSRLIASGKLKAYRFSSHTIRIDIRDLESIQAEKNETDQDRDGSGRFVPKSTA